MKSIQITLLIVLIAVVNVYSQTSVEIPTPPETPSISNSQTQTRSRSSSVSISNSNSQYKFRSRFHKSKKAEIEQQLKEAFSTMEYEEKKGEISWNRYADGEIAFECTLTKGRLRIWLNKKAFSSTFINKIEDLGEDLQNSISNNSSHLQVTKSNSGGSLSAAQARVERAKKELERSMENLKRVQKKN
ncbi:hypothetical protein [Tenacibaculum sp. M341]|uniref:hypothetical protein n=1 Tax=Tenacibaculum sp. M341 TaxID=2530339 RepID=UPI00104A1057|nr:hypothetical protein [Tenacibaculum sp. M341]TCI84640.1 hypothetical protein EYW44_20280 [Tenacibaculum sp. M341]